MRETRRITLAASLVMLCSGALHAETLTGTVKKPLRLTIRRLKVQSQFSTILGAKSASPARIQPMHADNLAFA